MYSQWHPQKAFDEYDQEYDRFQKKGKRLVSRRDAKQELNNRYKTTRQKRQEIEKSQKRQRTQEIRNKKMNRDWVLGEIGLEAYEDQKPSQEDVLNQNMNMDIPE